VDNYRFYIRAVRHLDFESTKGWMLHMFTGQLEDRCHDYERNRGWIV
jgi:hypothetical protein